jgi:uncharacterized protein
MSRVEARRQDAGARLFSGYIQSPRLKLGKGMDIAKHWKTIRTLFEESYKSSLHYALATVNEDGSPRVTPIAALFLRENQTGFYFEQYSVHMARNLDRNPRVSILAVNSDKNFWINCLVAGNCEAPPSVRLMGTVGQRREGTEAEIRMWQEKVAFAQGTKGHGLIWKDLRVVRDIYFDSFEPVLLGEMTKGLWA